MYDFHKSKRKGSTDQYFEHPLFQKGRYELLREIKRKSNKDHPNQNDTFNNIRLRNTTNTTFPLDFLG